MAIFGTTEACSRRRLCPSSPTSVLPLSIYDSLCVTTPACAHTEVVGVACDTAICTQDLFKVEEKQTFVSGGMIYFDKMRLLWQFHSSFRVPSTPCACACACDETSTPVFL
jgi:hypothetical protein